MSNYVLYHHGIKGMRWGVRRTPAQLGHVTPGKKKKRFSLFKKKEATKKVVKETEKKEELTTEQKKELILKTKSAKELYKNADLFSTQELQTAYNRMVLERNIASLSSNEVSKGEAFINKAIKAGKTVNDALDTGIKAYNNVSKIYNTFFAKDAKSKKKLIKDGGDKKD